MVGATEDGGWEGGSKSRVGGREQGEGGRRIGEGNERGRDGAGHGRREGKGREEASGGWIERGREGAWEQGREGNFTGGSIFTNQPFTNRPLPLRRWCYKWQIVNMYKLLTLYCDSSEYIVWQMDNMILCDGNYDWVHMACTRCIIGPRAKPGNHLVYIIREETPIFAPQRLPF